MIIRPETSADVPFIRSLTDAAFVGVEHSSQTEGAIIDALRQAGALAVSLVAEQEGSIIGHVGFSPVLIDGEDIGWFGLGPVSVLPALRRGGVGSALINAGLRLLERHGANGCVVLGDPAYYGRFGFTSDHALRYGDVPAEYFQSLVLHGAAASGDVSYHESFEAGCLDDCCFPPFANLALMHTRLRTARNPPPSRCARARESDARRSGRRRGA